MTLEGPRFLETILFIVLLIINFKLNNSLKLSRKSSQIWKSGMLGKDIPLNSKMRSNGNDDIWIILISFVFKELEKHKIIA